jgi:uncharacterized protein YjbJ (UPF0337 family)
MSKEGVKGATQKGVGALKETVGKAIGNEKLQAEGMADKAAGSAKEAVGKAKDAIHKATKWAATHLLAAAAGAPAAADPGDPPISNIAGASRWSGRHDMKRTRVNPWMNVGLDAWRLTLEASQVIGLRTMKIAAGGSAAAAESQRMVREKIDAAVALQTLAMTGGLGLTAPSAISGTLNHYRRKVRANRRRLAKG